MKQASRCLLLLLLASRILAGEAYRLPATTIAELERQDREAAGDPECDNACYIGYRQLLRPAEGFDPAVAGREVEVPMVEGREAIAWIRRLLRPELLPADLAAVVRAFDRVTIEPEAPGSTVVSHLVDLIQLDLADAAILVRENGWTIDLRIDLEPEFAFPVDDGQALIERIRARLAMPADPDLVATVEILSRRGPLRCGVLATGRADAPRRYLYNANRWWQAIAFVTDGRFVYLRVPLVDDDNDDPNRNNLLFSITDYDRF
jgi:hypothetical protein